LNGFGFLFPLQYLFFPAMKGIILAGGAGSRLCPFTLATRWSLPRFADNADFVASV
jgi:hypothetical protein